MNGQNTMPFVSAPVAPGSDSNHPILSLSVPDSSAIRPVAAPTQQVQMENMYPEIYYEVYPQVADAVNKMIAAGYEPTPDMLNSVVDNIIKNSGMWFEDDEEFDTNAEAVPAQAGFGRMPYRHRRRRHHNRNTLRDIIRILLLQELFRKRGGSPHFGY